MPIRVLVVDDERIIADTLAMILVSKGYECRTAYDGTEALEIAAYFDPDIIVSDIVMPKMDGLELTRQSRTLSHPPSILLISGNAEAAGMLEGYGGEGKSIHLLTKPIPPPVLLDTLQEMTQHLVA